LRDSLSKSSQGPNFGNALSQQATGPRAAFFITVNVLMAVDADGHHTVPELLEPINISCLRPSLYKPIIDIHAFFGLTQNDFYLQ